MKNFLVLSLSLIISSTSFADSERIFSSYYGDIDLNVLEEIMSESANVEIENLSMSRSYNPLIILFLNSVTNFREFYIDFTVGEHKFECDFVFIKDENKIMISRCFSETADLGPFPFRPLDTNELGLEDIVPRKVKL